MELENERVNGEKREREVFIRVYWVLNFLLERGKRDFDYFRDFNFILIIKFIYIILFFIFFS